MLASFLAGIIVGLLMVWPREGGFWRWYVQPKDGRRMWWAGFGSPSIRSGPATLAMGRVWVSFPWLKGDA